MNDIKFSEEARELYFYAYGDGTAYARLYIPMERRQTEQIIKLGHYDPDGARISWRNVARNAARLYALTYCGKGVNWRSIFSRDDIRQTGEMLRARFEQDHYMAVYGRV